MKNLSELIRGFSSFYNTSLMNVISLFCKRKIFLFQSRIKNVQYSDGLTN